MDFTLLIVDDEDNFREGLRAYYADKYRILDAGNLTGARKILSSTAVDLILLDVQIGQEYGPDLLPEIRLMNPMPRTILLTAYGEVEMAVDAMKNGAFDFLSKPVNFPVLDAALERAIKVVVSERELDCDRPQKFGKNDFIIGDNEKIRKAYWKVFSFQEVFALFSGSKNAD